MKALQNRAKMHSDMQLFHTCMNKEIIMENRLNFEAISDDELAKIVGGGYPNNQSMNDVLHWLNGHNDGNPKQLPKWMCGLG